MEWDVRFELAFAAEAKGYARPVQLEIAALEGLHPAMRGGNLTAPAKPCGKTG